MFPLRTFISDEPAESTTTAVVKEVLNKTVSAPDDTKADNVKGLPLRAAHRPTPAMSQFEPTNCSC